MKGAIIKMAGVVLCLTIIIISVKVPFRGPDLQIVVSVDVFQSKPALYGFISWDTIVRKETLLRILGTAILGIPPAQNSNTVIKHLTICSYLVGSKPNVITTDISSDGTGVGELWPLDGLRVAFFDGGKYRCWNGDRLSGVEQTELDRVTKDTDGNSKNYLHMIGWSETSSDIDSTFVFRNDNIVRSVTSRFGNDVVSIAIVSGGQSAGGISRKRVVVFTINNLPMYTLVEKQ